MPRSNETLVRRLGFWKIIPSFLSLRMGVLLPLS